MTKQHMQLAFDIDAVERDFMLDGSARAEIEGAAKAVLSELGLCDGKDVRRRDVVSRIATSWQAGHRLPLNLVSAGLDAVGA